MDWDRLLSWVPAYAGQFVAARKWAIRSRGSPPHTRGGLRVGLVLSASRRFTPACAGNLSRWPPCATRLRPRGRGVPKGSTSRMRPAVHPLGVDGVAVDLAFRQEIVMVYFPAIAGWLGYRTIG